ncbi:hypothetical protein H8959_014194 [Pygathrix nigripes]
MESLRGAAPVAVKPGAEVRSLLSPGLLPRLLPALGFKTKAVLKKRCKDCYLSHANTHHCVTWENGCISWKELPHQGVGRVTGSKRPKSYPSLFSVNE